MTRTDFKYVVLGLGGIGSGAAYWLSRAAGGDNVLGLEQFQMGHDHGASQDHSRIIRLSYHTPGYVRMAQQAFVAWQQVEADLQQKLIVRCGGLDLWPENPAIPMSDYTSSLAACGIPYEMLDASEIRRRFPQFHVSDDVIAMFQSEGGIAPAARCTAAHQELAKRHGATLLENTPVRQVRESGNEFMVITDHGAFRCEKLVVAGGAWSNKVLADFEIRLPLTITQEQVTYFASPRLDDYRPGRFPVWIWMDEPSFYGLPVYGVEGVKVAQDVGGKEVTTETRTYDPDPEALDRVEKFVRKMLPDAYGPVLYTKTCLYTLTPERDFVIDALPQNRNCVVAIGAGHAYKFASLIGRLLADLAVKGAYEGDFGDFRVNRPILLQQNPPKHFMT